MVNINQLKPSVEYTVDQIIANKDQTYVGGKIDIADVLKTISNDFDANTIKIKYGKFGDAIGGAKILNVGYLSNTKLALGIKYSGNPRTVGIMYFKGNTITMIEAVQSKDKFDNYTIGDLGDFETSPNYYKEADKIAFFVNYSDEILIVDKPSVEFKVMP